MFRFQKLETGYQKIQATKPQTLAYALQVGRGPVSHRQVAFVLSLCDVATLANHTCVRATVHEQTDSGNTCAALNSWCFLPADEPVMWVWLRRPDPATFVCS